MARIDDIGADIPSDPTISQIIDKARKKIFDVLNFAQEAEPIDEYTERILEKNAPKLFHLFRGVVEASELLDEVAIQLQETAEDYDVLRGKRLEIKEDRKKAKEKIVSLAFLLQNVDHPIIFQYLVEEKAKSGELAAIVAGLPEAVKEKLKEILE